MTPNEEKELIKNIHYNRGMIVGLQRALLEIFNNILTPVEINKVVERLKTLPAVMEKPGIEIWIDTGSLLPEFYQKGIEAGRKYFLEQLTRPEGITD